ncbi:MAG: thioredoxin TrxA [Alphaproteobacteria bacterium]
MSTVKVSDDDFQTAVLQAEGPVLVDYWAEWCGPCKSIAPALDEIAGDMGGKLTVAKLNIDENPMTPSQYGVRGIPTLMLFKDGQVVGTKVGAAPKSALEDWLKQHV